MAYQTNFAGCIISALSEIQIVKHDAKWIVKAFTKFYSNLAVLLTKLPKPSNRCTINSVSDYYRKLTISEDALFKLLKNIKVTRDAGIDRISGKFLKYMA